MLTPSDGVFAVSAPPVAAQRPRNTRRAPVRRLRAALAVFAVGVSVAVVAQASWRSFAARKTQTAAAAPLQLDRPRFTGVLKDGRAFLITAQAAVRDASDPDIVRLTAPVLVRGYGEPRPSQATAKTGEYREAARTLLLSDTVKITSPEGYAFDTPRALIDMRTGAVTGAAGVSGAGPKGSTRADSYAVTDKGDRVVLKGRVRTRLEPRP